MADRALYVAKDSGRNMWVGLWGQNDSMKMSLQKIGSDLQTAVEKKWVTAKSRSPLVWKDDSDREAGLKRLQSF